MALSAPRAAFASPEDPGSKPADTYTAAFLVPIWLETRTLAAVERTCTSSVTAGIKATALAVRLPAASFARHSTAVVQSVKDGSPAVASGEKLSEGATRVGTSANDTAGVSLSDTASGTARAPPDFTDAAPETVRRLDASSSDLPKAVEAVREPLADQAASSTASGPGPADLASNIPSETSDSMGATASEASQGLVDKALDVKASASAALEDAAGSLGKQLDTLSSELGKQLGGVSDLAGDTVDTTAARISAAKDSAADALAGIGGQLGESVSGRVNTLPAPVRDLVYAAAHQAEKVLANRQLTSTLAASAAGLAFLAWLSGRFGGYSGLLRPDKASTMLERENSLLLDIRSEDKRVMSGTPELRFGARTRGIALPMSRVTRQTGTQVVKAETLPYKLAAVLVGGLVKVRRGTKVIVLDDSEKRAIGMARAISAETRLRAYVLQGGLRGWSAAGLPVKPSIEYEGNALDSLNDTLQGRWLPFIRDPVLGPLAISLTALGSAAVYDVHRTLQFIGVFAFLTTLGTAPVRYSSKQEAIDDVFGPYIRVANFFGRFLPKSRPASRPAAVASSGATAVEAELVTGNEDEELESRSVTSEQERDESEVQSQDREPAESNT